MARPKKEINEEEIFLLASYGLTREEIAAFCNCSVSTLDHTENYRSAIKEGHTCRNASLRKKQYEVAMHGNIAMLIWLGKQYLGQTEKVEQFGEVTVKEAVDAGKRFVGRVNGRGELRSNGHQPAASGLPESS